MSADQLRSLSTGVTDAEVNKITSTGSHKPQPASKPKIKSCPCCPYKHEYGKCPARGKTCNRCGKLNHFAEKCRSSQSNPRHSKPDFVKRGTSNPNPKNKPSQNRHGKGAFHGVKTIVECDSTDADDDTDLLPFSIDYITRVQTLETEPTASVDFIKPKDWS